jgi:hypothetical protein
MYSLVVRSSSLNCLRESDASTQSESSLDVKNAWKKKLTYIMLSVSQYSAWQYGDVEVMHVPPITGMPSWSETPVFTTWRMAHCDGGGGSQPQEGGMWRLAHSDGTAGPSAPGHMVTS